MTWQSHLVKFFKEKDEEMRSSRGKVPLRMAKKGTPPQWGNLYDDVFRIEYENKKGRSFSSLF